MTPQLDRHALDVLRLCERGEVLADAGMWAFAFVSTWLGLRWLVFGVRGLPAQASRTAGKIVLGAGAFWCGFPTYLWVVRSTAAGIPSGVPHLATMAAAVLAFALAAPLAAPLARAGVAARAAPWLVALARVGAVLLFARAFRGLWADAITAAGGC